MKDILKENIEDIFRYLQMINLDEILKDSLKHLERSLNINDTIKGISKYLQIS